MLNKYSQAPLNHHGLRHLYHARMSVGARIRQLRNSLGLSGERFGELMGVSKGMVSQWESDDGIPSTERLMLLRKHVDFSLDWLLFGVIDKYASLSKDALDFAAEWEALDPDRRSAYKTTTNSADA
jgi:transcriptional regulator with XRE-family HTH domain